jgi:hypothetical protein
MWDRVGRVGNQKVSSDAEAAAPAVGKRTIVPESGGDLPRLQLKGAGGSRALADPEDTHSVAAAGVAGRGSALPHLDLIQRSFGPDHDLSRIGAHVGGPAAAAAEQLGARAYAAGDQVAFAAQPDLHTAAHEAAHVVQQRGGVQLEGGLGAEGDEHEAHADAVADRVVRGEPAADLLARYPSGGGAPATVQRAPAVTGARPAIASPVGGINKPGFIDNSDGANLRTGPAEADGQKVTDAPLPPATRVFVSGTHPSAAQWWYVTAFLPDKVLRGYVQDFRVTTNLPEPLAKLHQVKAGDTAEKLAVQEFKSSVRDGHDLRYYENVLLFVNKERGRAGITGTYQDPGLLGGSANNVQLVAGHRIWLVSPAFAHALEGVVPDGSLTNGVYAKVKRFVQHVVDIIKSVTQSPHYFGEVAGEYAQIIRDHLPEIIGIVAGFVAAEAASAFLAATPTGVGQIAAVLIQLMLAAFGVAGMIQAGIEAMKHAGQWLTLAWNAKGKDEQLAAASKEFLRMLVSIATAALAYAGVKGNFGKAVQIAEAMPPVGMVPALANGGSGPGVGAGVKLGVPGPAGPLGTAGGMKMENHNNDGGGGGGGDKPRLDPAKELEQIKEKLRNADDLSGKEKQALRARKKELQQQLGEGQVEVLAEDVPRPTEYKKPVSGLSGKEAATDAPSWIDKWPDARPGVNESGTTFAIRMMNRKYGIGNWQRAGQQGTEFSQLKKFADRGFE